MFMVNLKNNYLLCILSWPAVNILNFIFYRFNIFILSRESAVLSLVISINVVSFIWALQKIFNSKTIKNMS